MGPVERQEIQESSSEEVRLDGEEDVRISTEQAQSDFRLDLY